MCLLDVLVLDILGMLLCNVCNWSQQWPSTKMSRCFADLNRARSAYHTGLECSFEWEVPTRLSIFSWPLNQLQLSNHLHRDHPWPIWLGAVPSSWMVTFNLVALKDLVIFGAPLVAKLLSSGHVREMLLDCFSEYCWKSVLLDFCMGLNEWYTEKYHVTRIPINQSLMDFPSRFCFLSVSRKLSSCLQHFLRLLKHLASRHNTATGLNNIYVNK